MRTYSKAIGCFALFVLCAAVWAQGPKKGTVKIQVVAEKEITVKGPDGEKVKKRVEAKKVLPGETVIYTIRYSNVGQEKADDVVISNPIPKHMIYRDGSALGADTVVTYSINHGKTFAQPDELEVKKDDGSVRLAGPGEYTAIRWTLTKSVLPGQSGSVTYSAVLK